MATLSPKTIKLIIGLGNPGRKYENTYHNAGFLFVDYLQNGKWQMANGPLRRSDSEASKWLKSNVYMNESGGFVKKALKQHGAKPEELLVAHDDSDIELGKFKLSFGRGSAGHKGVESTIKVLGTKNFWRLRIGIRPTADKRGPSARINADGISGNRRKNPRKSAWLKAEKFVLKKIALRDKKILEETFEKIAVLLA